MQQSESRWCALGEVTRDDHVNLQSARSIPVNHHPRHFQKMTEAERGGDGHIYDQSNPSISFTTIHTCLEHPSPPPSYSLKTHSDYTHEQWSMSHYLE